MKTKLLTVFTASLLLFGCAGEKYEKELKEIETLRAKLSQSDSLLGKIDVESAERLGTEIRNNSQFVQFNINKIGDSIDFKTGTMMSHYGSLLRSFETVEKTHERLQSAIDSTRQNLDNLEYDLKHNSLAQGLTPAGSVELESEQVTAIYERSEQIRSMLDNAKKGYDTLAPKITGYMQFLNQRLAEKEAAQK